MRSILAFAIAGTVLFNLAGCNKSGGSNTNNGGGGQASGIVKSFEVIITDTVLLNTYSDYVHSFSYDNNNKELTASQTGTDVYKGVPTNLNFSAQFSYAQGIETETGTLQFGTITSSSSSTLYLNSNGYPYKTVNNTTSGSINAVSTGVFTYDANGYCTETDYSSSSNNVPQLGSKTLFSISGGNVVQEDNYLSTGSLINTITYSFGNTPNKTSLKFSTPPVAGHYNNNLVTGSNTIILGVTKSALKYSYVLDGQGRVTSATVATPSGKTYMQYKNIQYLN